MLHSRMIKTKKNFGLVKDIYPRAATAAPARLGRRRRKRQRRSLVSLRPRLLSRVLSLLSYTAIYNTIQHKQC